MEMYLTFRRRCNQRLLERSWFPSQRSLLLPPPLFFQLATLFHPPNPNTFASSMFPYLNHLCLLPPHPSFSLSCLKNRLWFCLYALSFLLLSSIIIQARWRPDHTERCIVANHVKRGALVGVSGLGRDHNCIYMIMKMEKLRCSCLGCTSVKSWRQLERALALT